MKDEKEEYLKRAIKRTYKQYTGERKDGQATIKDVADFFNIPIDSSRLEDYKVSDIKYDIPSIEIVDTKNNITNYATYISGFDITGFIQKPPFKYIALYTTMHGARVERIYNLSDKQIVSERILYDDGLFIMDFDKQLANSPKKDIKNGRQFKIEFKYKNNNQKGFIKVYKDAFDSIFPNNSLEETYTKSLTHDKCFYIDDGNLVYIVDDFTKSNQGKIIKGVCLEQKINLQYYLVNSIGIKRLPYLTNKKTLSAMLFDGAIDGKICSIEIYKTNSFSHIKYSVRNKKNEVLSTEEYDLPICKIGNITPEDIQIIINYLQGKYSNDEFIDMVITNLLEFAKRIDIKNNPTKDNNMLSPKVLIDKSFDEIGEYVYNNRKKYLDLMLNEFLEMTDSSDEEKQTCIKRTKKIK